MRYTAPVEGATFSNRHGATIVLGPGEVLIAGKSFIESALKAGCNVEPDDTPESAADREKYEASIREAIEARVLAEEKDKLKAELTLQIRQEVEKEMREEARKRVEVAKFGPDGKAVEGDHVFPPSLMSTELPTPEVIAQIPPEYHPPGYIPPVDPDPPDPEGGGDQLREGEEGSGRGKGKRGK